MKKNTQHVILLGVVTMLASHAQASYDPTALTERAPLSQRAGEPGLRRVASSSALNDAAIQHATAFPEDQREAAFNAKYSELQGARSLAAVKIIKNAFQVEQFGELCKLVHQFYPLDHANNPFGFNPYDSRWEDHKALFEAAPNRPEEGFNRAFVQKVEPLLPLIRELGILDGLSKSPLDVFKGALERGEISKRELESICNRYLHYSGGATCPVPAPSPVSPPPSANNNVDGEDSQ